MHNYDNYGNSFLINVLQQMQNYDNYGNSFLINSLQAIIMIITAIRFYLFLNNYFRITFSVRPSENFTRLTPRAGAARRLPSIL